jgi:hypothetical protein
MASTTQIGHVARNPLYYQDRAGDAVRRLETFIVSQSPAASRALSWRRLRRGSRRIADNAEVEVVVGAASEAQQRRVRRDEVVERLLNLPRPTLGRATQLPRRRDQAAAAALRSSPPTILYTSAPCASVALSPSPTGSATRIFLIVFFGALRAFFAGTAPAQFFCCCPE